jgi:hypothetical protein
VLLCFIAWHAFMSLLFLASPCESFHWWDHPCLSLESLHTLGPSFLRLAWLLSVWRDVIMSKPSHDFLTRCAWSCVRENLTACLLLTSWQAVLITTLPWIVPVYPGTSQARTCKTECVTPFYSGKRTGYSILSEQMLYYSRYATGKKGLMLRFSCCN